MINEENYFSQIIEQCPFPICIINISTGSGEFGKILYKNQKFTRKLKSTVIDSEQNTLWAFDCSKNNIKLRDRIYKMALNGSFEKKIQTTFLADDGDILNLILNLSPINSDGSAPKELIIIIEMLEGYQTGNSPDISKSLSQHQDFNNMLSLFGHDLKNHVGGINMLGSVLDKELVNFEQLLRNTLQIACQNNGLSDADSTLMNHFGKICNLIDNISSSSHKAYNLLEDFLFFRALQTGKQKMMLTITDMQELMTDVCDEMQPQFDNKNIQLHCTFPNDPSAFKADPKALYKVLQNLMTNSLKFTPKGGKVHLAGNLSSESVIFTVEDSGVGIDGKIIPDLFNVCKIISSRGTEGEEGTGFGLPICYEILAAHSGSINIESKTGDGTKCTVEIPQPTKLSDIQTL